MRSLSLSAAHSRGVFCPQFKSFGLAAVLATASVFALGLVSAHSASAAIGVSAFSLSPSTQAHGSNPDLAFSASRAGTDADDIKQAAIKLPPGLGYSLAAVPKCSAADFSRVSCPAATTIGSSTLNGKFSLLGVTLLSGDVTGTLHALSNSQFGVVYSVPGFSPIPVRTNITGSAVAGLTLAADYPRTGHLFGGIPLDLTIARLTSTFSAKSGPAKNGATIVTNPTSCGMTTATVTLTPFGGSSASRSSAYSTTGCDSSAPAVDITMPLGGVSETEVVNVAYVATDNDPTLSCVITNNAETTTTPITLIEGPNVITVTCSDDAGNAGSDSVIVTWTPPVVPETTITKFADPSTTGSTAQTVEFSGGPSFQCRVNAGSWTACVSPWTVPIGSLTNPAQNTYEVRSTSGSSVDGTPAKGYIWFDTRSFATASSVSAGANSLTSAADAQKAGRHPDLEIALASTGSVETKSLSIRFPDGLALGLAAVPSGQRCSLTQANAGMCPSSSRIGALSGLLANPRDGDVAASGSLFLVDSGDPAIPADVLAAIAIELTAPNNLGTARALGYLKLPKTDGSRRLQLDVAEIPNTTIASTSSETRPSALRFLARSLTLNLDGDTGGTSGDPAKSLLTNPHYCGSVFTSGNWARPSQKQFVFTATDPNGFAAPAVTSDYLATGCEETVFSPSVAMSTVDQSGAPLTASETPVRLLADIQLPPEAAGVPNATIARTMVQLPPQINPYFPAIGTSTDQCQISTALRPSSTPGYQGYQWFDPISPATGANVCTNTAGRAANSRVGTAVITSPLMEHPLQAAVYHLSVSAIPALAIWVDPSVASTNPKGLTIGLYVKPSTTAYAGSSGGTSLTYELDSLPDLPITRIQLDLGSNTTRPLGAPIVAMASSTDPSCVPKPTDDPTTPYDDSTATAANAITRLRPWSTMLNDNWASRFGATYESLLNSPAPGDVETQSALPITGCVNPEE